ncbi:MAG: hypothetical protein E6J21_00260 [Chloroflexota bacterium]|nr:MAG: hypothetical protein E6J21_00260 [Chloroflexota bacterium]
MVAARTSRTPAPPPRQAGPIVHASHTIKDWLALYWQKLNLPTQELGKLAITQDRQEYMRWTGKRLNSMVLGCYCYLPAPHHSQTGVKTRTRNTLHSQTLLVFEDSLQLQLPSHRHLIFIEPDMQPQSIEVTVAHELIHLADRINVPAVTHRLFHVASAIKPSIHATSFCCALKPGFVAGRGKRAELINPAHPDRGCGQARNAVSSPYRCASASSCWSSCSQSSNERVW